MSIGIVTYNFCSCCDFHISVECRYACQNNTVFSAEVIGLATIQKKACRNSDSDFFVLVAQCVFISFK